MSRQWLPLALILVFFFLYLNERQKERVLNISVSEECKEPLRFVGVGPPWEPSSSVVSKSSSKDILYVLLPPRVLQVIVFESNFYDLLGHFNRPVRYLTWDQFDKNDRSTWKFIDNSLIVAFQSNIFGVDADQYFQYAKSRGVKNIGVYHMGDGPCMYSTEYYQLVDYAMRNHLCQKVFLKYPSTLWIPNGWADLAGPKDPNSLLPASIRKMDCYFAGRPTPERKAFLSTLSQQGIDCQIQESEGFGLGKSRPLYGFELGETRFALCPGGESPETIRFYDALENGAIPVLVNCNMTEFLFPSRSRGTNPPPVLVLDDWSNFGKTVAPYLRDPQALDALQSRSVSWWQRQKEVIRGNVAKLVDSSFSRYGLQ